MKRILVLGVVALSACELFSAPNNGDPFQEDGAQCSDRLDNDGDGAIDCDDLSCAVACTDNAPIASDDSITVDEDLAKTFPFSALTGNDVDPEGKELIVVDVSNTQGCQVELVAATKELIVTPDANLKQGVSFSYTVEDPGGNKDTATVTVTINPVNDTPTAVADNIGPFLEDNVAVIPGGLLTGNDDDPDTGDSLVVAAVQNEANGTALVVGGSVEFTPDLDYVGPASFEYQAKDLAGALSGFVVVSFTIDPVNDAPVAVDDNFGIVTDEDTSIDVDPLGNDTDVDIFSGPEQLFIDSLGPSVNCSAAINGDLITITPNPNYFGPASVVYTVRDIAGLTDTATISLTVNPIDDAPIANADTVAGFEDTLLQLDAAVLLANDVEFDGEPISFVSAQNANNGSVSFLGNNISFVPAAGFIGDASFEYTIRDASNNTSDGLVTVVVDGANDAPVAQPDTLADINEDNTLFVPFSVLLNNDTDADIGDVLTVGSVQSGANGVVSIVGTDVRFVPTPNATGLATFTYTARDLAGADSAPVLVSFNLLPVNDAPVAADDSTSTLEDAALIMSAASLLANDSDIDGDALSVASVQNPANGTVSLLNGTITFTPAANFHGDASFEYVIVDPAGLQDVGLVSVVVTPVNDAPVAADDIATATEDIALNINEATLTANDTDLDGDLLTIVGVQNPTNGSVSLSGNTITFTPATNFFGATSFEYVVDDGNGGSDVGLVSVTVLSANDAPVANGDTASTNEDTAVVVSVLDNDTDLELDALSVFSVQNEVNGVASISNNQIVFTPDLNFNGTASFEYTITDGNGGFDSAAVTVSVAPVNDAPSAGDDVVSTPEDTAVVIDKATLLQNDFDLDGDSVFFVSAGAEQNGSLGIQGNLITFTPNANFNGSASFEYTITDGVLFDSGLVIVAVGQAGDAPVAGADSFTIDEDTILVTDTDALLQNDTDVDGDLLVLTSVQNGVNGVAALAGNTITFTPNANFHGAASFEYTVTDGFFPVVGLVSITVNSINDAPTADSISVSVNEDNSIVIDLSGADVDGDSLQLIAQGAPSNGTLSAISSTGANTAQVTYTPNANFHGSDSFSFIGFDGVLSSSLAVVSIDVVSINDAPVASDDGVSTNEDTLLLIDADDLLLNDLDADFDLLAVTSLQSFANCTATLVGGTITLTPNANKNGEVSFEYVVSDGNGGSDVGLVTVSVAAVNDAPSFDALNDRTLNEDAGLQSVAIKGIVPGPVTATDEAGQVVVLTAVSSNKSLIPDPSVTPAGPSDATLTFTPAAGASGVAVITVTAKDNGGTANGGVDTFVRTFTVTVNDVNDIPSFDATGDFTVNEDSGQKNVLIKNISAGLNEPTQTVVITAVSSDQAIIPNPSVTAVVGTQATMSFTPALNASGVVTITLTAQDNGGTANGGVDVFVRTFTVTVVAVADQPNLTANNVSGNEDTTIPLDITSSLVDVDGSESLSIKIDGVLAGSTLSAGSLSAPGASTLGTPSVFTVGSSPVAVAVGSFNGDASRDLAIVNNASNNVSILLGNGDGTFGAPTNFGVGTGPQFVSVGRFNADAFDDLAVANQTSANVSILLGNGDGTFGAPTNFAAGTGTFTVVVGRFNGDNLDDLAVANPGSNNVSILLGNGDGTFSAPTNFVAGANPRALTVGRFNSDAFDDLAVVNLNSANVSILLGNGNGTFGAPTNFSVGTNPRAVVVGKFNGDSFGDLAVANFASGSISILLGNGDGTFGAASSIAVGTQPPALTVASFSGDTFDDLVVVNFVSNTASVLLGNGDGTFGAPTNFPASTNPRAVAFDNFNNDAFGDLAVVAQSSNNVRIFPQLPGVASATLTQAELVGLTLTPPANFNGVIPLTATARATEASNSNTANRVANFSVNVISLNDPPLAVDDNGGSLLEDTSLILAASSLLANDSDPEGSTLSVVSVQNSINGSASLSGGNITFTPTPDFFGAASFDYVISDGQATDVGHVSLSVTAVNDAPSFNAISNRTINEDAGTVNVNLAGVTAGPNESAQTVVITATSSNPAIIPNPTVTPVSGTTATLSFAPVANANGVVTITVTAQDNGGTANGGEDLFTSAFVVTVNAVNDAPVANNDTAGPTNEDTALNINVASLLANDTDVENNTLTVTSVQGAVNGAVSLAGATITFTPTLNFSGSASFQYTISDGQGGSASATVSLSVIAVADQPNLTANNVTGNEDTAIPLSITAAPADSDGSESITSVIIDGIPAGATLSAGTLTPGVGGFGAATNFATGVSPNAVATGRFNADAFDDLAVANLGANTVSILLGNGGGSFGAATNLAVGSAPTSVVVGRFNADAFDDLAVTNASSNNISVLLGNGAGTFGAANNFTVGAFPNSIAVGRFNGDAIDDLAVVNSNANNGSILLGDGAGSFTAGSNFSTEQNPRAVRVGRFNADAIDDLVVANANSNNVSVLLGNGAGAFSAVKFNVGAGPNAVAVGRFNADAFDDIASANTNANNVSILLGNGAGAFSTATNFAVGTSPLALSVGRFNGDTFDDLAVVNSGSSNVSILLGNGAGAFGTATNFAVGAAPTAVALGKFNGDALLDLAVTNQNLNNVSILSQVSDASSATLTAPELTGLTLTPPANRNGVFNLTTTATSTEASNGSAATRTVNFTVTVNSVNDAPIANAQTVTTNENTPVSITLTGSDPDGDPITFTLNGFPTKGFLNGAPPNIQYTPNGNFSGTDTFGFQTRDSSNVLSNIATVTVNVLPICGNGNATTLEGCDDGNTTNGDGCSSTCTVESGFTCTGSPSSCFPLATCNATAFPGGQGFISDPATGHCFVGFAQTLNWFDAESACETRGGYLISPDTATENDLARTAVGNADIWLGLNDLVNEDASDGIPGDDFIRVTGAGAQTFNGFRATEPNNSGDEDCVVYNFTVGVGDELWNDFPCGNVGAISAFICEFEANPCGDGVVQSAFGEQCDDRNRVSGDGCSNTCTQESGFLCVNSNPADGFANSICSPSGVGSNLQITSLTGNGCQTFEHNAITADDRGGIAVGGSRVIYSGDGSTGSFDLDNLNINNAFGFVVQAPFSDISTGKIYSLGTGGALLGGGGGTVNSILELNPNTGAIISQTNLSVSFDALGGTGIFSGPGRVVVFANNVGTTAFDINIATGNVTNLGAVANPTHVGCESFAYWGVAEFFGGQLFVTYVQNSSNIVRTRIPDGFTQTVAIFSNLADMCSIGVDPLSDRWYFHQEGPSQFHPGDEVIGFCDATFNF